MWILVSEGVGYHNQSKHFLYTPNPGPPQILPDYIACDMRGLKDQSSRIERSDFEFLKVSGINRVSGRPTLDVWIMLPQN